ncbi:hypothetical protein MRX96_035708 [Rhipicephalus microplus]
MCHWSSHHDRLGRRMDSAGSTPVASSTTAELAGVPVAAEVLAEDRAQQAAATFYDSKPALKCLVNDR